MSKNTDRGYGFEFACVDVGSRILNCSIDAGTQAWLDSKGITHFRALSGKEQQSMTKAAEKLFETLVQIEPWVDEGEVVIERVRSKGGITDVRDILIKRVKNGVLKKEIGVSLKSNHDALKHQRISPKIDVGQKWLGVASEKHQLERVKSIFKEFKKYCNENDVERYSELEENTKDMLLYSPICQYVAGLFEEVFNGPNGREATQHFLRYLIGSEDFYKARANFKDRELIIDSFNIRGSLKKGKMLKMPQRCLDVEIQDSDRGYPNKINVVLDNGWEINLRVHNASSRIETSLKWDSQLVGIPREAWQTTIPF